MAASLERRDDGSVALFINGDLQFDSKDERVYHESLVHPAIALAASRTQTALTVLVIGGGDGLVARELFKSAGVAAVTLVDYDPEILSFARTELSTLNESSLSDSRMTVHVQDAWEFVDQAIERNTRFDVIISDLTVAENIMEARFHSVEWYAKLAKILNKQGILAVNGVSPQATPQAYWSIFNSILKGSLHARPYHITIPSFSALGYGPDWGFFLASPNLISKDEIDADFALPEPREFLLNAADLQRLFLFPDELFAYQPKSSPAHEGSDILLHYLNNSSGLAVDSGVERNAFSFCTNNIFVPEADTGKHILPPELCSALAKTVHSSEQCDSTQPERVQLFLHEVLDLMPSLQREQTSALIADFLEAPTAFLQAIDLPELVKRLLKRASELPLQLVTELKLLQEKLVEWADDQENLLRLGHRVATVLILAIVVGNLLYPDAVYGKGTAGHHGGYGRGGVYGNNWGGGTNTYYNNTRTIKKGPIGPGPNAAAERDMRKMSLPQRNDVSNAEYMDESGSRYPTRRYRTAQAGPQINAVYRLGPGTDILTDGHIAMPLTDRSYLLVTPQATHVMEQQSGRRVMSLQNDPALLALTTSEISRQLAQLAITSEPADGNENALHHLNKADQMFKNSQAMASNSNSNSNSLLDGVDIFPSVSLTTDGQFLAITRDNGAIAYLDGQNWYSDMGGTPLAEAYPEQFRSIAVSYLTKMVRDTAATKNALHADRQELTAHMDMLNGELAAYEKSAESVVNFGTRKVPKEEAIRLTQLTLHKSEIQLQALNKHLETLPGNVDVVKIALANISAPRRA